MDKEDNMYSPFERPDVERVLKLNKYMTNVGGHNFKGDMYQHYKWSWSRKEMEELVSQKKATRIMFYHDVVKYYCIWMGYEQATISEMKEFLKEIWRKEELK